MSSRHALVVSYLALFIALGGTAAALQGKRSVKADDLASGAVTSRALAKEAVKPGKIEEGAIVNRAVRSRSIGELKIRLDSINTAAIRDQTIRTEDLAPLTSLRLTGELPDRSGATLITREVGGKSELIVAWPGGASTVIATSP